MAKVVIVGAGLTGLSLAYELSQNLFFDYEIFEKESIPGGLLKSVQEQGFTFDYTGHFLHISNESFRLFLETVLGLENCNSLSRESYIYAFDRYIPYPFQQNIRYLPDDVAFECLEGFIKRSKRIRNPNNFYEWVLKYFGPGFGKHFFFPYNSKLLNLGVKKIMPSWTSRFVPSIVLKDLFNSLIGEKLGSDVGYNAAFHYPKEGGIFSLVRKICEKIPKKINCGYEVAEIDSVAKKVIFTNGRSESYDVLVTTAPLPNTLKMIKSSSLSFSEPLRRLRCNSVFNFNLGIAQKDISKMHWVYFPEKKYLPYRIGFWHNFAEGMVPVDHSSVYGEVSFLSNNNFSKIQEIGNAAVSDVLDFLELDSSRVVVRQDLYLPYAYVIYDAWREKNLSMLLDSLKARSIYSIGRFGEWKYSSMQEAYLDGMSMAKVIMNCANIAIDGFTPEACFSKAIE